MGHVRFEDVSFSYDGERPVLQRIDLEARPGEVVALVGRSGAGKSTLMALLLRLYDPTAGRVLIDGIDLRKLRRRSLLGAVAPVFQEAFLFDGTIFDNIRYGAPGTGAADVERAAWSANAMEFIAGLADGLRTSIGERGNGLSGGQKQRIAIARALVKDAPILIFDEATAFLDSRSKVLIQDALRSLREDHTVFLVAHRLSTLRLADRVVVLDGGRVVEEGGPELLEGASQRLRNLFEPELEADADGAMPAEGPAGEARPALAVGA